MPIFTTSTSVAMTKSFTLHVFSSGVRKKRSYFDGNKNISWPLGARTIVNYSLLLCWPAPLSQQVDDIELFYYIKEQTVHGCKSTLLFKDILYD